MSEIVDQMNFTNYLEIYHMKIHSYMMKYLNVCHLTIFLILMIWETIQTVHHWIKQIPMKYCSNLLIIWVIFLFINYLLILKAKKKLENVNGFIVDFSLEFLSNEKRFFPDIVTPEGILPKEMWTWKFVKYLLVP